MSARDLPHEVLNALELARPKGLGLSLCQMIQGQRGTEQLHNTGTDQCFQTPRALQTQGQVMMMGGLEPGQLTGKYFSSPLTGYEPHMEVSCFVKGKRNQRDSSSYTTCRTCLRAAS